MRGAIFMAMVLTLARDRAALVMAFVLPAVFFTIFALIFVGASGGDLTVRLAIADEQQSEDSARFVAGLVEHPRIEALDDGSLSAAAVRAMVRNDEADVGVVIRGDARPIAELTGEGEAPIEVVGDPTREIPVSVVQGAMQEVYVTHLTGAVLRAVGGGELARSDEEAAKLLSFSRVYERRDAVGPTSGSTAVAYYAGAVAVMFLLFSSLNGAISLVTERENGLIDRIATGPGGIGAVVDGKFGFLVVQGIVQVTIIFLVAWIGFGVDLPGNILYWTATTVAAAITAAALALGFVAVCRTHAQAQTIGTVAALIISALGGSMVPRFLMPDAIRDVGWITPNAWVIDAYGAIFWRGEHWDALMAPWSVLAAAAAAGLIVAHVFARRRVW